MNTESEIAKLVTDYIREELYGGREVEIDPDANIFTSGLVDSLGIMKLIAHVEKSLALKIPPPDLIPDHFRTINVMAGYLAGQKKRAAS